MFAAVVAMAMVSGEVPIEPPVVYGATPLEEPNRYRIPRSWDETIDYYKREFRRVGGIRWRNIVNSPSVRAKHIQSLRKKTKWAGLNIYEYRGEVRLYVLMRPQDPPNKKKARGKK